MNRSFTTVNDVTAHLIELEPAFAEIDHDTLQEIVRANSAGRYEDISEDEIDAMYNAAMTVANEAA